MNDLKLKFGQINTIIILFLKYWLFPLVPNIFINLQKREGVLNCKTAIATIKAIIARKPNCFVIPTASWAKRLLERVSFERRAAITGKLKKPEGARK